MKKWFIKYGLKLLAIYLVFYIIYSVVSFFNGFYIVKVIEANMVYMVMRIFYPLITINGNTIGNAVLEGSYTMFSVSIDDLCLGWFPIAGFASMILALPGIGKRKIGMSLLLGVPVLFTANLLRVVAVMFAAAFWGIRGFNFFHIFVVKFDLMALIVIMFLVCIKFVIGKEEIKRSLKALS